MTTAQRLALLGYTLESANIRGGATIIDAQGQGVKLDSAEHLADFLASKELQRPWHRIEITGESVMLGALGALVNKYSEIRLRAGGPLNAAIYQRDGGKGAVTVFFSPRASELAPALLTEYDAKPSREQPTGISMLVGDDSDPHNY